MLPCLSYQSRHQVKFIFREYTLLYFTLHSGPGAQPESFTLEKGQYRRHIRRSALKAYVTTRKFTCVPLLEPPTRDRLSRFQAYKYLQTNKWVDCGQISLFSVAPGSSSNCSYGMIKIFTLMQNIEFWKVCGKITLLSTTCTHWSIDFVLTATVPELKQINRDM
jgi:hypothetical protein